MYLSLIHIFVRQLVLSLFSRNIYGNGYTLTVCIIDFQRPVFAVLDMLFVHKAYCRIAECKAPVVIFVQIVAVTRKGADEQFQLVVGSFADMYYPVSYTHLDVYKRQGI